MTDKLQALYDGLKGDYNLGSMDEFRNNMNDEAKRRMFYDAVSSDYDLGDYDSFNTKLGYGEGNAVEDATQANQQALEAITPEVQEPERPFKADDTYLTDEDRQAVADTAKMSWKEAKKLGNQLAGIAGQRPTEESSQRAMDYLNANRQDAMQQEEIKNLNQKRKTEAAQPIAEQLRDIAQEYKEQAKVFRQEDNDLERRYLELTTAAHNYATEQCGPMPTKGIKSDSGWGKAYMDFLESNDPDNIREKYNNTGARSSRNNTVSFLEHMANQTERRAKATIVQGSVSGIERTLGGAWYGLTQPGSWSLGISDLWTAENVISLANKLKDGKELTDYEQAALDAYGTYQEAAAILHEYDTRGFKAGETTGEMVPFMVQMALNPGGGLGEKAAQKGVQKAVLKATEVSSKEAAEAVAEQAMREYGTMATKDLLRNYGVDGMMARIPIAMRKVGGDLAASAVLANTLQIGSTINDVAERKYGAPVYEDGHYTFDPEQERSLAEAAYKAELAGIIENFTEMMGEWRVLGIADKMSKFGSKKVGQMVRAMGDTDFARGLGKVLRDAHWSGVIGETMEEEYGIILNSLLTGDNKLSDLWDLDQQLDIFLGVGLFGGVMGGAKMAAYPIEYANRKKNLEERTAWNREIIDDWDEIQDKIDSADDTALAGIVKSAILRRDSDKESKAEQVKAEAIIRYVDALQGFRGITIARDMLPADADEKTMQAFWLQGYDGTDKQAVKAAYEHKKGQIELIDPYLLQVLDNEGINAQIRNEEGELEDLFQGQFRLMAMDYLNAKAAYDGMLAGITDRAQSKARETEVMVRANDNNGQQIEATTRTGDKVHIVSGEITMAGEVASLDNSSPSIIIRHEDGSQEMVSPLFIKSVDNVQDTETVVQASMQRVAQETILQESQEAETPDVGSAMQAMADTELAKERGTEQATYQQGDEIALPDGTTGIVNQGVGQTEDGKVEVIWNEPREGKKVEQFTADELYNLQHPAEAAPETAQDEEVLNTESAAMPSAEQQAYDEWVAKHGDNAVNKLNQTRAYAEKELAAKQEEFDKVQKELNDLPDIEDAAITKKKNELEKKAAELQVSIDNYTATLDRMNAIQSIYDAQNAQPEDKSTPIVQRAEEWARNTGVKANIITRVEDVTNAAARQKIEAQIEAEKQGKPADRVKGWYDTKTKEVYFFLPNIEDAKDLDETYIHEVVAHRGLNELLGRENYATLCRQVWNQLMNDEQRQQFLGLVSHLDVSEEAKQLAAADEFIAYFAEQMQMNPTEEVKTTWQQLIQMLVDLLRKISGTNITEQDLSDLLVDSLTRYKLRNQQNVQPQAENKMQPVKIEEKKKRIKREEPTEFEMIQGAVEDIIDELDFATQVRYAVSKYRFLWKDTPYSKGLANSIIATKGGASEKDRRQYFVWTAGADKGGQTPEQIAHAILADMPEGIAEGHDTQEVLDIILDAVQSAKSPTGLVRQVYEDIIAREKAADREYEEMQQEKFAKEQGFGSYEEYVIFEAKEDLQTLTEEEWNNLYANIYDTTGEGNLEPGVQGMVQPATGQGTDISRGNEMGLGAGSNGQGAGNERAEAQAGTTDVLPESQESEVVQPQRTIFHPSTLVQAYQSGDATSIAETEKAMRDFIMSTPKEDKRKIEVTMQQAKEFIRKNKKDESQANIVRMNQFVLKCCKDRLKEIEKEPVEEKSTGVTIPDKSNIQDLETYSEEEIQDIVTNYINEFKDYLPEDFKVTGVRIVGSRANGTANEDSDLDILVQYEGGISEDALFNLLNEGVHEGDADNDIDPLAIDGIRVDINPIRPDKSGTIDEWLERNKDYKKEQPKLTNEQVEAIAAVEGKTPAQVRTEKQQDTLEDVSQSIIEGREEYGNTRYLTEPVINDYLDIPAVQDYLRKFGNENTNPEDVLQQASGMAYVQYGMPLSILFAQAKNFDSSKQKVSDIMSGKILYRETPQNTTLDQVLFRIDVNHNSPYLLKKADGAFIDPITGETLGFDNRFALTGEGNNVHGYGSYFSVNDLREYAGKDNPMHLQRNIRYKGNWYKWDDAQDIFTAYDLIQQEGTVPKAIRKAEKFLNNAKEWGLGDEAVATWRRVVDFMNNSGLKKSDLKQEYRPDPGHHYDVTIPDNTGTNYLEEMITLRPSQRRRIADAVRKLEGEPAESVKYVRYNNGWESLANMIGRNQWAYQEIRDRLVQAFGGKMEAEKRVSDLMSSIGFTGVHYNGRLDGECYVIFNPEDAEIVNHTMFRESKVTPEQDAEYKKAYEEGNTEKAEQMVKDAFIAKYPKTKVVLANGEPQVVYHGTPNPAFTTFAKPGVNLQGLVWLSQEEEYAGTYAMDFNEEEYKDYSEPYAPQDRGVYQLFANIVNPLNIGDVEDVVGSDTWNELAENLGMTPEGLFNRIGWDGSKYEDSVKQADAIYELTRGAKFVNLLKEKGYDGVEAVEGDDHVATFGAVNSNQVKSAKPFTFDDNGNLIPLSERFNQQSDDIRFREANDRASLMGAHNISEEKLKKVLKQGGLANPSMAIVDTDKYIHKGYGNISLIPYSSQLDASKTRGVMTYSGDAYSPSYPGVTHKLTGKGEKKIDEMAKRLANGDKVLEDYLHTRIFNHADDNGTRLSTAYLLDKGIEPDIVYESGQHTHEEYERVKDIIERWRKSEETAEDKKVVLDILMQQEKDRYDALVKKAGSKESAVKEFAKKRYKEALERITDEDGELFYSVFDQYLEGVRRSEQLRNERKIDLYRTEDNSLQKITQAGLSDDYWKWVENLFTDEEWPEMLFGGWTPAGYRRWIPNTLENASRLMNKQADRNADDWNGWNATKSLLLKKMRTLTDIRRVKEQLRTEEEYENEIKDLSEGWTGLVHELSDMQRISDNQFSNMDYAENRLQEAILESDPISYLNKEYGYDIDKDSEFAKDLLQAIDNMKKAPAKYFETKFTRPVYLYEFKTAITPDNMDAELKRELKKAGINVVDYKANDADDYERKVREATEGDTDVRFRVANANQAIFVSNAQKAVENIKQEKGTPDQWLAMIQKQGGLKAGEDKWMGLSQWLNDRKAEGIKTLTKPEILDFIDNNKIEIEEDRYVEENDIKNTPKFREFNDEYLNLIANSEMKWEEADREYTKFMDEMQEKYGEDWDIAMSGGEHYEESMLLNARERWQENPAEAAFNYMVEQYGDDFDTAFMYNEDGLDIADTDAAAYYLEGDGIINDVRLGYTTEGLENKREIALTVPTIEPWGEDDEIHFGDAGGGTAIGWIRFGETYDRTQRIPIDRHVDEFEKPVETINNRQLYYPKGGDRFNTKEYVVYGRIRTGEDKYVLMVNDGNKQIGPFDTLEDARKALNEWYENNPKTKAISQKILAIDEIQSKRHQAGREQGYKQKIEIPELHVGEYEKASTSNEDLANRISFADVLDDNGIQYGQIERIKDEESGEYKYRPIDSAGRQIGFLDFNHEDYALGMVIKDYTTTDGIPDAPFDKNWPELCMKRMLRLAAEEGYDKMAWTSGEIQADRYNLGKSVRSIFAGIDQEGNRVMLIHTYEGPTIDIIHDDNGNIISHNNAIEGLDAAKNISDLVGKEIASDALAITGKGTENGREYKDDALRVGISGMQGFYDKMLPAFMTKYGKQWGIKPELQEFPDIYGKWWTIDITPEMKADVMEGQVMFRIGDNEKTHELNNKQKQPGENYIIADEAFGNISRGIRENEKSEEEQANATESPNPINDAKIARVSENLAELSNKVTEAKSTRGFITWLSDALEAETKGASRYSNFVLPNGTTLSIRVSNHNANAENYKNRGTSKDSNISIVIKPRRRQGNTFIADAAVSLVEYSYLKESLTGNDMASIVTGLAEALQSGEYIDKTGKAKVNTSGETLFRLSKNNRKTIESWLNKRTDIDAAERESTLAYIDNLADAKTQLATGWWFAKGTIRLPEDMPKVEQAVAVSTIAKVDPLKYSSPMELINAHADIQVKEKPINPDEVSTLHKYRELPDGIVIYDVDDTEESRKNMRAIIDTHFGKESSPWCLLQGDGEGNLTRQSREYWDYYNSYPKQVAFKDGKLLAFSANRGPVRWWDRMDQSHVGIPVEGKVPGDKLGRSAVMEYDPVDGEMTVIGIMWRGNPDNGLFETYYDTGEPKRRSTRKNHEDVGHVIQWHKNGQKEAEFTNNELGQTDGPFKTWYASGQLRQQGAYYNGWPAGVNEDYYENGQLQMRSVYPEKWDGKGHPIEQRVRYFENGQMLSYEPYDKEGIKNGTETQWFQDGTKEYEVDYVWNEPKRAIHWYQNGDLESTKYWDESGNKTGTWEKYNWNWDDKKSVLVERTHYNKGFKDGLYEEFYNNGNPKTRYNFVDGVAKGLVETWNNDGKPFLRKFMQQPRFKEIGHEYYNYDKNEVSQLYTYYDFLDTPHNYTKYFPMDGYKPLTAEELATYPEWVKERAVEEDGIDIRFRETPSLFTPEEMTGNVAGSQQSINFAGNGESTNIQREGAAATTEGAGRGTAEVREATSVIMPLRALEPGETCHAERKLAAAGEFSFIGKDYLESIDDIAFIFKKLETKAVENAFLTFVKDGKATVLHVGMGAVSQSALDLTPIAAMMRNINPDKVYFIHNHPSGNLVSSKQDREIWKGLRSALGEKLAPGIIIDTTKGVYGQFGPEISMEKEYKEDSKGDVKIPVYRFDERVFDKDYDPTGDRLMNSRDIAAFVASQRLGERDKISVIVSDYNRNIVGNFFLPYTRLDSNTTINKVATDCAYYCGMTGGNVVYIYGNGIADRDTNLVSLAARKIKDFLYNQQIILNDIVGCYNEGNGSYYSYNDHGIMEPLAPYGAAEPVEGEEIRFREVTDPAQVKELEESKKGKGYRNVTLNADGTLGSPKAGKLGRKGTESVKTSPFILGKWEQSEEDPDMADENGKVNLIKPQGRGSVGSVDYNPYIHIRPTTLNKQFTQAWARPELAYVETEYPESELKGEYKAEKAKLSTGRHAWNGGELILSRYDKPMRIVPWTEVADEWEKEFKDSGVTFDIVPPALLPILAERGVKILSPKKAAGDPAKEAYNDWKENGSNATYRSMVEYGDDMLRQKAAVVQSVDDNAELSDILKMISESPEGTAEYETYNDIYILAASGKSVREAKKAVINNTANATEDVAAQMTELALAPVMTPLTDMAEVRYRISREPSRVRSTYNDGDITVFNPRTAADVQAAVMRESYTHKDIRNVKGWDKVTEVAYRLSGSEIAAKALRNGMDFDAATEEWMYENAERMVVPFTRMLAENGVNLMYHMTGDEIRMYLTKSGDLLDDADLFITKEELPVEETVRFRVTPAPSQTRDQYDASQQALSNKLYRAYVDYTKPLRDLQDIIAKDSGEPIKDFENAWEAENQRSSKSKSEIEKFELEHFEKIRDAVRALEEATGMKYDDVLRYLIAKHGLERNVILAQRDAEADYKKYQQENPNGTKTLNDFFLKRRERDYSGLTDLSGEKDVLNAEIYAQDLVDSVERSAQAETDELWQTIADAVETIQKKRYQSGLISKDQFQHEKDMFEHYIPLRGFAETIAEDVYDYYEDSTRNRPQRDRKAQGRTSLADDPLATLGAMAASAIQAGNKNLVKQRFLNMVENHDNDIATVKDVWVVNHGTATDPVWEPEYPDIHEGMDADDIKAELDSYTQRMEQLKNMGLARKATNKLSIKWRTLGQQAQQHIITVRRNGQEQMIIINGNPQVARTVNGINNPDANLSNFMRGVRAVQRFMAANFTTRNPAFVVSNLCRDLGFATMAVAAKENEPYRHQFMKNVMGVATKTVRMGVLIKKWQRNELDMNNEVERYFAEFMENGGETGYTAENTVDAFRKKMEKGLKKRSKAADAGEALLDFFELCNRSVEDFTRFTTYMTSRQMGRTVQRSVADAKNITVNFNRKGSGEMGQKYIASAYLFLNAGIQSLQNVAKISGIDLGIGADGKFRLNVNGKKLAKSAATLFGSQIMLGMIVPMLNEFMMGLMGGDDDDDVIIDENGVVISTNPYRKLTEYERRNNLCFWLGGNRFVKIPLAIELRAFYGLGETMYGMLAGIPNPNPGADVVNQMLDLLPVNFVENGGMVPDAIAPVWESFITNRNYQGIPLYNDSDFLEQNPEASKAYSNTGDLYITLSRWINELGGGDDVHKSDLDTKLTNPAVMQHIVEGYLGGLLTTTRQTAKLIGQPVKKFILGKDVESIPAREWPVVNRLYINTDKRNDDRYVKDRYYFYRDKAEQIRHDERGYLNNIDDERYARKYEELVTSPEYLEYITFDALNKNVKQAHQDVKEFGDEFKVFEVDAMRELVNALDEEAEGKISPEQWGKNLRGSGKNKGE